MAVTVTTPGKHTNLTTLARLKADLGITVSTYDDQLTATVQRATAAVEAYCHRTFAREAVSETTVAYGGPYLHLERYPVATVSTVTYDGETKTDYTLHDKAAGILYREDGWAWTVQSYPGLTASERWEDFGSPVPGAEEPLVVVTYTAGYLTPDYNVSSASDVSASSVDNSFNSAASAFPALLKAGDIITTSGFTNAGNNGRFLVTGTPTTAKVIVSGTLTTELGNTGTHVVTFQTVPYDLEMAALETAKAYYLSRQTDPGVVEKQVGPMRLRYSETDQATMLGIPTSVVGLLRPYVRRA